MARRDWKSMCLVLPSPPTLFSSLLISVADVSPRCVSRSGVSLIPSGSSVMNRAKGGEGKSHKMGQRGIRLLSSGRITPYALRRRYVQKAFVGVPLCLEDKVPARIQKGSAVCEVSPPATALPGSSGYLCLFASPSLTSIYTVTSGPPRMGFMCSP